MDGADSGEEDFFDDGFGDHEEEEEEEEEEEAEDEFFTVEDGAGGGVRFDFSSYEDEAFAPSLLALQGTVLRDGTCLGTLRAALIDRDALGAGDEVHMVADAQSQAAAEAADALLHSSGYPRYGELPTLEEHGVVAHGALVVIEYVEVKQQARGRDIGLRFVGALLRGLEQRGRPWTLATLAPWAQGRRPQLPPLEAGQEARERWHAERVNAAAAARGVTLGLACCAAARAALGRALLPIHLELITLATLDPQQRAELRVCRHFARLGFVQAAPCADHFFITPALLRAPDALLPRGAPLGAPITPLAPPPAVHAADARLLEALRAQLVDAAHDVAAPSEAVRAALRAGARLDRACALHKALDFARDGEVAAPRVCAAVRMLLSLGAGARAADEHGSTALHVAAQLSQLDAAEVLLAAGARAEARDACGDTPAHLAAQRCRLGFEAAFVALGDAADQCRRAARLTRLLLLHGPAPLWRSLGLVADGALTPRMRVRLAAAAGRVRKQQEKLMRRVQGRVNAVGHKRGREGEARFQRDRFSPHELPPPLHVAPAMPAALEAAAVRGFAALLRTAELLLRDASRSEPLRDAIEAAALAGDAAADARAYLDAGGSAAYALGGVLRAAFEGDAACGRGDAVEEPLLVRQLAQLPHLSLLEDDFAYAAHALGVPQEYMNWEPAM